MVGSIRKLDDIRIIMQPIMSLNMESIVLRRLPFVGATLMRLFLVQPRAFLRAKASNLTDSIFLRSSDATFKTEGGIEKGRWFLSSRAPWNGSDDKGSEWSSTFLSLSIIYHFLRSTSIASSNLLETPPGK